MYKASLGLLLQIEFGSTFYLFHLLPRVSGSSSRGEKGGPVTWAVPSGSTTLPRSVFSPELRAEFGLQVAVVGSVLSPGTDLP